MFGLMKQTAGHGAEDLRASKGRSLGASSAQRSRDAIDGSTRALVGFCAFALGEMNGRILVSLERHLNIEPQAKPELRKLIVDSFHAPQSLNGCVRLFKKSSTGRHNAAHRLIAQLCTVARDSDKSDRDCLQRIILAAKALGLSQSEIMTLFTRAGLVL